MDDSTISLYVDAANVPLKLFKQATNLLEEDTISVPISAFGDWGDPRMADWRTAMRTLKPIQCNNKCDDFVDVQYEMFETIFEDISKNQISKKVGIVTRHGGYDRLATHLKSKGHYVIGIIPFRFFTSAHGYNELIILNE